MIVPPPTLLSIIYHGTIAQYADEMHAHPDEAFERYQINGGLLRKACLAVDDAAFRVRKKEAKAQEQLEATSTVLFERLESILASEIADGVPGADQPKEGTGGSHAGLVTDLYLLMYSQKFRDGNPPLPGALAGRPASTAAEEAAWQAVKAARAAGSGDFAALLPHTRILCQRMKAEFDDSIWTFIW
jgi:hypothetical protein